MGEKFSGNSSTIERKTETIFYVTMRKEAANRTRCTSSSTYHVQLAFIWSSLISVYVVYYRILIWSCCAAD